MLIAFALEGLVLVGLVFLMRWNKPLGIILTGAWLFTGFGVITFAFSELVEEPKEVKLQERPKPDPNLPPAGSIGKAVSVLNPSCTVEVSGKRFDARSVLSLIRVGSCVRVIELQNRTLIVEEEKEQRSEPGVSGYRRPGVAST